MHDNERRKGPDLGQRILQLCSILAWLLFLVAMVLFHFARPEVQFGLLTFWGSRYARAGINPWETGFCLPCGAAVFWRSSPYW
ncbi:hypothetical protein [Dongshaea marina]|uniref:hypothetical protein n=1 Tax=Dongshaea marina TaxID=2047966 RepID=UPI000D3E2165|nr:hypothetical protein [Dongshaea marina]